MHQSFGSEWGKGCIAFLVIVGLFVAAIVGAAFAVGYYMGKS